MGRGRVVLPVVSPLRDGFDRQIEYLRISLSDRCNYRCTYCMPDEGVPLMARSAILRFEELESLVATFARLGVRRVRLTGGEPTVRRDVVQLVTKLSRIPGIEAVCMTSNGHLLDALAGPLAQAGLTEINVSIDTLDPHKFQQLTRRGSLPRVVAGIDAALAAGMRVKTNTVALAGTNDDELANLCEFAWARDAVPRFIEHMPMSDGQLFVPARRMGAEAIRSKLADTFKEILRPASSEAATGPSRYWQLGASGRRFGIISAMTEHFCSTCNRVRLTADGQLHTCLASDYSTDLRGPLRAGVGETELRQLISRAVAGKLEGHTFHISGAGGPKKHMVSIGG